MPRYLLIVVCCVNFIAACGDDDAADAKPTDAGAHDAATASYKSPTYSKSENWLCHPSMSSNRCKGRADATEIGSDKSRKDVAKATSTPPKLDCFYVYPTIDLNQTPQQVADYTNIEDIWISVRQQAEIFSEHCTVYAPLYHQVTIGAYFDTANRDSLLDKAYAEVEDAFRHYLDQSNKGRDIVFIGHSQGSHMLRRLLQKHFDGAENAALRKRLAVALLIGPLGDITVPPGKLVGGTFSDIPVCQDAKERGCIVTYSSYSGDKPPGPTFGVFVGGVPMGMDTPCTNPAAIGGGGGGKAKSAGAYFQTHAKGVAKDTLLDLEAELGVTTYFTVYRDVYTLECKQSPSGTSYLAVNFEAGADDKRKDPILYMAPALSLDLVGLHILDFELATDDLANIVRQHVR